MLPKMDRRPARSSLGKRGRAQRCAAFRAVCKRAIRTFRPEQPDPLALPSLSSGARAVGDGG